MAAVVAGWPEMVAAGIATPLRVAHFLATCANETGGFNVLSENLNYSAEGLRRTWPTRFKSASAAAAYAHQPQKIANYVYANRLGNGPPDSGDGWRFRGGGYIQTTGRSNYRAAGHEADPEALRDPKMGFTAAIKFWTDAKVNPIADRDDATALRKRVNGGVIGLDGYKAYLAKAKTIFVEAGALDWGGVVPPEPIPGKASPTPSPAGPVGGGVIVVGGAVAAAAGGLPWWAVTLIVLAIAGLGAIAWWKREDISNWVRS